MDTIHVDKIDLLAKLRENRDNHQTLYNEACEGYRETATAQALELVERLRAGEVIMVHVPLTLPQDHKTDYDTAISMMEWHQGNQVELDMQEFMQYVEDNWGWKQAWTVANAGYSASIR